MLERERKFLVKSEHRSWLENNCVKEFIQQGYIFSNYRMNCRVRIINNTTAFLCIKFDVSPTDKNEFEYQIDVESAYELYEHSTYRLEKTRYTLSNNIIMDVYPDGDAVIEIEFTVDLTLIPYYCGEEVTGNPKYSNVHKAMYSGLNGKRI